MSRRASRVTGSSRPSRPGRRPPRGRPPGRRASGRRRPDGTPPLTPWGGVLLAALPAALGGLVVWRGGEDLASGDASAVFPLALLLGLSLSGTVGAVSLTLREPHAERWFRVATFLGQATVVAFFGGVIVLGLVAPALLASPGSGRAPDTPGEARVAGLLALVVVLAVGVPAVLGRRRARAQRARGRGRR